MLAVDSGATAAPPPRGRPSSRTTLLSLLLVLLPVVVLGVMGWRRRWMSDDGFINVRVIDNLMAGHGPVFNVGERVEVGTSTLWLVVVAVAHLLTPFWSVSTTAVLAGLLCAVLGALAATAGACALWRTTGRRGPVLPLGTVVLAALPPVWDFTTSGLEMGLVFLWLGGSFLLLALRLRAVRRSEAPLPAWRPLWPAVVIGLGPLVRPDLALISLALGLALLAQSRRGVGSWLGAVAAAGALPVAYELLRSGYYAALVPNTALAKSAGESAWGLGLGYLRDYAGLYLLALPLGVAALAVWLPALARHLARRDLATLALLLAPVVGGLLHGLYVVRVGGDFMHGRFLLPATFSVLLPVAAVATAATRRGLLGVAAPVLVVSVWALVVGTSVRLDYPGTISAAGIADERGVYARTTGSANPVTVEDWATQGWHVQASGFAERAATDDDEFYVNALTGREEPGVAEHPAVVRMLNVGIFGTVAGPGVLVADGLSLADPVGSRLVLPPPEDARAGHSQEVPEAWHLARYAEPSPEEEPAVTDARAALGCGDLAELQDAVGAPMTWGRFWDNLTSAPGLTLLEVPGDPAEAREAFCRAG